MAKFRMRCPECGDKELGPEGVDLQWCSHEPASFYRYACPECGRAVTKACDGRTAQALIAAGVRPIYWHLPAEAMESHAGPAFTLDDVLDFHLLLQRDDWMQSLQATSDAA